MQNNRERCLHTRRLITCENR